jgi:hypothetical protein
MQNAGVLGIWLATLGLIVPIVMAVLAIRSFGDNVGRQMTYGVVIMFAAPILIVLCEIAVLVIVITSGSWDSLPGKIALIIAILSLVVLLLGGVLWRIWLIIEHAREEEGKRPVAFNESAGARVYKVTARKKGQ